MWYSREGERGEIDMIKYFVKRVVLFMVTFFLIMSFIYIFSTVANMDTWMRGYTTWDFILIATDQYIEYLKGIVTEWNFGIYTYHESLWDHILTEIPLTFQINIYAFLFYTTFGIFFGILAAYFRRTWLDKVIQYFTVILGSVPGYITMLFFMLYLGYRWGLFPGRYDYYAEDPISLFQTMALPILALSLGPIAQIIRVLRGELIEELDSPYIELVRTKGFNKRQQLLRHALKNSVLPVITIIPRQFAMVLSMSFIIEITYNLRGAAFLFYQSVITPSLDGSFLNINVEATTLIGGFYVGLVMVIALCMDFVYALVDPRVRIGSKKSGLM